MTWQNKNLSLFPFPWYVIIISAYNHFDKFSIQNEGWYIDSQLILRIIHAFMTLYTSTISLATQAKIVVKRCLVPCGIYHHLLWLTDLVVQNFEALSLMDVSQNAQHEDLWHWHISALLALCMWNPAAGWFLSKGTNNVLVSMSYRTISRGSSHLKYNNFKWCLWKGQSVNNIDLFIY